MNTNANIVSLRVHSAVITGPDASRFSVSPLNEQLLNKNGTFDLNPSFLGASAPSTYNATLAISTDQNAPNIGAVGDAFVFPLQAVVANLIADPHTVTREKDSPVTIPIASLLSNDSNGPRRRHTAYFRQQPRRPFLARGHR